MKITYHHATSGGSQKSSENTKPVAVYNRARKRKRIKGIIQENTKEWTRVLSRLPPISRDKNHDYLVTGKKSFGMEPKGALKHKINVYQLFKEGSVKKKKTFLVKCLVPA